ncbi:MAG TPA: hypothetical protein VMT30_03990 [Candidatus Saccharimonadia bacterium]|nr:hypothetical protein [Candidatus Saccharimonadia bacterium]
MTTPDLTTISTVASTVAVVMGGFLWLASRIFGLGKNAERLDTTIERLDSIESDIASLKSEMRTDINAVRNDLNQRMDKLILTIADSRKK